MTGSLLHPGREQGARSGLAAIKKDETASNHNLVSGAVIILVEV